MNRLFNALKRNHTDSGNIAAPSVAQNIRKAIRTTLLFSPLILLAGGAIWFFILQNQSIPVYAMEPVGMNTAIPHVITSPVDTASHLEEVQESTKSKPSGKATLPNAQQWTHPQTIRKPTSKQPPPPIEPAINRTDILNKAYQALSIGNLDQAKEKYLTVLTRYPHEKDALLGLAVIAHRNGHTDRAIRLYRQVLNEDMGNVTAAASLITLSTQLDPIAAESQLRELLDIRPTSAEFHYALGGIVARMQRWGEAQQAYFNAYSLKPDNALYAYNLAVALDHLHQPAAIDYYRKAATLAKPNELGNELITQRIRQLNAAFAEER